MIKQVTNIQQQQQHIELDQNVGYQVQQQNILKGSHNNNSNKNNNIIRDIIIAIIIAIIIVGLYQGYKKAIFTYNQNIQQLQLDIIQDEQYKQRVISTKQILSPSKIQVFEIPQQQQIKQQVIKIQDKKSTWKSLKVLQQGFQYHDTISKQSQGINQDHKDQYLAQTYASQQLNQLVKNTRYFDIHYFIDDDHTKYPVQWINRAKPRDIKQVHQKRPLLQITKTRAQLQQVIQNMMYPKQRPQKLPPWQVLNWQTTPIIDQTYYFFSLSNQPQNKDYLQAEYYRYDKLYNIGQYQKQLPICLVTIGKNDALIVQKMLETIRTQNYTNYRVIHVDDVSDDKTVQIVKNYLNKYPQFKDKFNLVQMRYKRNALYNRDWANRYICREGDIIVDLDADDWIIGNQVFQLINSIYQAGKVYRGKREQLWAAYFTNILKAQNYPYVVLLGDVDQRVIEKGQYRSSGKWRTTALRTYLWDIYNKIDQNDLVDKLMTKQGQQYVQAYDVFLETCILEMSAPKHLRFFDQYVYFYTGYLYAGFRIKTAYVDTPYSIATARLTTPYNKIQTLYDTPTRRTQFQQKPEKLKQLEKMKKQVVQRRQTLLQKIKEMYARDKKVFEDKKVKEQQQKKKAQQQAKLKAEQQLKRKLQQQQNKKKIEQQKKKKIQQQQKLKKQQQIRQKSQQQAKARAEEQIKKKIEAQAKLKSEQEAKKIEEQRKPTS